MSLFLSRLISYYPLDYGLHALCDLWAYVSRQDKTDTLAKELFPRIDRHLQGALSSFVKVEVPQYSGKYRISQIELFKDALQQSA